MSAEPLPTTLLQDRMPDWWRPLGLDLDGERLARRREGVEALRQALSLDNVVNAVAFAHGDVVSGVRIIGTVRSAARSADGAFAGDVGDAEPPAMVAAALCDQLAVNPGSELSTVVSLLVLSANYGGHGPAIDGMALAEYAARQLEYRAASSRRAAALDASPSATRQVQDALAAMPETGTVVIGTAVGTALSAHGEILVQLAARIDEVSERAAAEHAVLRETLRQQTWLLESWCETADLPWSEVPADARPLIAALEHAERTNGSAPAIGAASLLASLLSAAGGAGSLEPDAAVVAAAPFLDGKLTAAPSALLFPIATALARCREGQPVGGWAPPPPDPDATAGAEPAIGWDAPVGAESPAAAESLVAAETAAPAEVASSWDTPAHDAVAGWDAPAAPEASAASETAVGWDTPAEAGEEEPAAASNGEVVLSVQAYREALALRVLGHE
jgi:hypothetical protein